MRDLHFIRDILSNYAKNYNTNLDNFSSPNNCYFISLPLADSFICLSDLLTSFFIHGILDMQGSMRRVESCTERYSKLMESVSM